MRRDLYYQHIIEESLNEIYIFDAETLLFLEVNRGARENLKYTIEELRQMTPLNIKPEYTSSTFHELMEPLRSGEKTKIEFTTVHKRKDGTLYPIEVHLQLMSIEGTSVFVAMILDITSHKKAETELRQVTTLLEAQRQRLRNLIANVPGVVWEAYGEPDAADQRIDFVSDYVTILLGYSIKEWTKTPNFWLKIVHPDDQKRAAEETSVIFNSGGSGTVQFRWMTKDRRPIPVEAHSAVIFDKDGQPIGMRGVTMDISERIKQQNILSRYARQLRRSNEELQQFAYIASHDLQEPLRMVASYLELLEKRYGDELDDDAHDFIAFAVDGAMRMKTLISDLLAYSRLESRQGEFEQFNLGIELNNVRDNLRLTIEETGALITTDELPTITADKAQVSQLFQNLVSNALKFKSPDRPPEIHIGAECINGEWRFSLSDNGIGIESDYLDRIFVIFQRLHTKAEYPGTGIGLAICKRVIDHHGGRIWVDSQPGKGTTFYFTIPADIDEERDA
jgi:PAS domain S-box-containing protein